MATRQGGTSGSTRRRGDKHPRENGNDCSNDQTQLHYTTVQHGCNLSSLVARYEYMYGQCTNTAVWCGRELCRLQLGAPVHCAPALKAQPRPRQLEKLRSADK